MINSLLDQDVIQMDKEMQRYQREMDLANLFPKLYKVYCFIFIKLPGYFAKYVTCRIKGHDVEHDDWASPESGGMSWYCRRNCGAGRTEYFY